MLGVYLSAKCPVVIAPAMDRDMYKHPATISNINTLMSFKDHHIIDAEEGELASGLYGEGRMAEPINIINYLRFFFAQNKNRQLALKGKKALITAGPTYEAIDPVRYIGNHSSGKMGFAIAETLAENGAEVLLISGPSTQQEVHPNIKRINVTSSDEMYKASIDSFANMDIAILSAAVADYKPALKHDKKLKKNEECYDLKLVKTKDILKKLGEQKKNQILVGFALETNDEISNATQKLKSKNLDFIVLNSLNDKNAGFKHDTNKITLLDKDGTTETFPLKDKKDVAKDILKKLITYLN